PRRDAPRDRRGAAARIRASVRAGCSRSGCRGQLGSELSRDIAAFRRHSAEAVAVRARVVGIDIAVLVQGAEEFTHALEYRSDERGLLVLGVGPFGDADLEPESGKAGLRERMAGAEPVGRIDRLHQDGGDLRILVQDLGGEIDRGLGNSGFEAGFGAAGGIGDSDHGHGESPLWRKPKPWAIIAKRY